MNNKINIGDIYVCTKICLAAGHRVKITDTFIGGFKARVEYVTVGKDNMGYGEVGEKSTMIKDEFLDFYSLEKEE